MRWAAALALWVACALPLAAQEAVERPDPGLDPTLGGRSGEGREPAVREDHEAPSSAVELLDRASVTEELLRGDEEVRAAFREALIARYRREADILAERRSSIAWTNWIGRFVFLVVHVILYFGLRAALQEFAHAARTRRESPEPSEIRVSLEGVALKTSLHGFLILFAAFGFYVLYIRFVYPITVVG